MTPDMTPRSADAGYADRSRQQLPSPAPWAGARRWRGVWAGMTMHRTVVADPLDGLSASNPAAIRSRHDLRRAHRLMGTRGIVVRALLTCGAPCRSARRLRVLELGAGDGSLMLSIARALQWEWPAVNLTLLDRLNLVDAATVAGYAQFGWQAQSAVLDALDWATAGTSIDTKTSPHWDLIVSNRFLQHFDDAHLRMLLRAIGAHTNRFFACEPRRGWIARGGSHLIGAIGAATATRTDAVSSVHAGFCDRELSALWPSDAQRYRLKEYSAGLFSHCLYVERYRHAQLATH